MRQESGRSMIEMLGVLAIMGVITAGAAVAINRAMGTQRHMQVDEDIAYITSNVRELHRDFDSFESLNNAILFDAINISNKNPYGGTYEVNVDPSNSRQFIVSINGLSEGDCKYFVAKGWRDSIGYQMSGGTNGGASGNCNDSNGKNTVYITYGE